MFRKDGKQKAVDIFFLEFAFSKSPLYITALYNIYEQHDDNNILVITITLPCEKQSHRNIQVTKLMCKLNGAEGKLKICC